jgi:serine/threonine protein phosphatase PrpC
MINGALKLNCGRAFGNLYLKSFPEEEPPLTATPTITFVQLPDTHTACCLATDGLWNFVVEDDSHGESTHVVSCSLSASLNERRLARMSESTCSELAKKLCDRAHRPANGWQVTDDISVVLLSIAPEKRG